MSSSTEGAAAGNRVVLTENGPLGFTGELVLRGEPIGAEAWFCRCGNSANKPYCDGSHRTAGRALTGEPAPKHAAPLAAPGGPLLLEPQPNGPLKVTGSLEVVSASGRVTDRVTQAWFCRCGRSQKAPYCDGTHRKVGFQAP